MLFIQIAITAVIVHVIADNNARKALNPFNQMALLAAGKQPEAPIYSIIVSKVGYWTAVLSGLIGAWSL